MVQGAAGARELPYDALLLGTGRKANVDSVGAISKHPARLLSTRSPSQPRGKPGFSTLETGCGRESDSPLEGWREMDSNLRFPVREVVISAFAKWNGSR